MPSIEAEWRFEGTVGHQEKGATTLTAVVVQCAVAGVVGLLAQAVGGLNGGSDGGSVGGLDGGSDGGWQRDVYVGCQTMVVLCLMFVGWRVVHYVRQGQQAHGHATRTKQYQWSLRLVEYGNTADKTDRTDDTGRSSGGSGGSGGNAANSDAIVPCTIVLGDTMPWRKENPAFPSGGAEGMKEGVSSVKAGDATTPAGATGDTTGEGNLARPMSADSTELSGTTELSAVKGYWDQCPAAMFMVRDGPTIAEYKRTRHKRPSPKAMYEVLTGDLNTTISKPSHVVDHVNFTEELRTKISQRHALCLEVREIFLVHVGCTRCVNFQYRPH